MSPVATTSSLYSRIREYAALLGSTALYQGATLALNMTAAKALGPGAYGTWNLLLTFVTYATALQLGVSNGMGREIPLARGSSAPETSRMFADVGLTSITVGTAAGTLILLTCAGSGYFGELSGSVVAAFAIYFAAYQFYSYIATYWQACCMFHRLALLNVLLAVLTIGTIPMLLKWGLWGLLLGQALALSAFSWSGLQRAPVAWKFDRKLWWRLVRSGVPIVALSTLHAVITSVDRWIILGYLSIDEVGKYAFQAKLATLPVLLVTVVLNQAYPRLAEAFGRTGDARDLAGSLRKLALLTAGITLAAGLFLWLALPPAIGRWLPQYHASVDRLPLLLAATLLLSLCTLLGTFLTIVGEFSRYLLVQAAVLPFAVAATALITRAIGTTQGTALGVVLAYAAYLGGLGAVVFRSVCASARG